MLPFKLSSVRENELEPDQEYTAYDYCSHADITIGKS